LSRTLTLIKGLRFDQYLRESTQKPRKNPINTLRKSEGKKEKQRERKMWGNTLLIYPIKKVQDLNIEGLTSFEKKESEREIRKEKRRKNNNL